MNANAAPPTWIVTKAKANISPRSPKAFGIATDITRLVSITPTSIRRTGNRSGSNQLVTQVVVTHADHNTSNNRSVSNAPATVSSPSSRWESCITAKT